MEGIHMNGETASVTEAAMQGEEGQGRQRSTISFPYVDIGAAFDLANAIHSHVGLGDCDEDQLAAWTNQSSKSSGFREQVRTARMAGVIEAALGKLKLTDLGRLIVDPSRAREGKARAFLNVPLFNAVFEKYRGGLLPPPAALERDMVGLGVSEKQKDRARQAFERSADLSGFFEHGKNRLVMPGIAAGQPAQDKSKNENGGSGGGGGGGGGGSDHSGPNDPLIQAIIQKLPSKGPWPMKERITWMKMLAMAFDIAYGAEEGDEMEIRHDPHQ
jgi:hypothetical protein